MKNRTPLISAILLIVAGVAFVAFPVDSLAVVLRIIGALVLLWVAYGIWSTVRVFKNHGVILPLIINNFFAIVCSGILLVNPIGAIKTLSIVIGLYLAVTSGLSLYRTAMKIGRRSIGEIITSTITLIVGIWLIISPFDMTKLTALFIGVAIAIKGVGLLISFIPKREEKSDDYVTDDFVDKTDE